MSFFSNFSKIKFFIISIFSALFPRNLWSGLFGRNRTQCEGCQKLSACQCKKCSQWLCKECFGSSTVRLPPPEFQAVVLGSTSSVAACSSACNKCMQATLEQMQTDRVASRLVRVEAFFDGKLVPFSAQSESGSAKAVRLGSDAINLLKSASTLLPVGTYSRYLSGAFYLAKYGPLVFYSSDLLESIGLVVRLLQTSDMALRWSSTTDLTAGVYYLMAENRGLRGESPDREHVEHLKGRNFSMKKFDPQSPDHSLLVKFCSLAVHVGYESSAADAQRLLRQQGFDLVLAETIYGSKYREFGHTFFLAANKTEVVLIFPGSRSWGDLATDLNAFEEEFNDGGKAHLGIANLATKMFGELHQVLVRFSEKRKLPVRIVGHSLGAGIAALLTLMLFSTVRDVHCYAFAPPPCVDMTLAEAAESCVTSVVLRDDIVCRASRHNVHQLVAELGSKAVSDRVRRYLLSDAKSLRNISKLVELKQRRPEELLHPIVAPQPKVEKSFGGIGGSLKNFFSALLFGVPHHPPTTESPTEDPADPNSSTQLYLPGRILHIYSRSGQWHCGFVKRTSLCQIELHTEMVSGHFGSKYFEAVSQLVHSRSVAWQSFSAAPVCGCCGCDFLWNSVLQGEPHLSLAKHVCRRCGVVVCAGCSDRFRPIFELGITSPVRHCDRCWMSREGVPAGML